LEAIIGLIGVLLGFALDLGHDRYEETRDRKWQATFRVCYSLLPFVLR